MQWRQGRLYQGDWSIDPDSDITQKIVTTSSISLAPKSYVFVTLTPEYFPEFGITFVDEADNTVTLRAELPTNLAAEISTYGGSWIEQLKGIGGSDMHYAMRQLLHQSLADRIVQVRMALVQDEIHTVADFGDAETVSWRNPKTDFTNLLIFTQGS